MTAAFDMHIPERFAAELTRLHPDGAQHAAAAALRLYLDLGELGVKALQARATHEGMAQSELILNLLANPAPGHVPTITQPAASAPTPRKPNYRQIDNVERDRQIADEYFTGTTTYPRLAAKYGLSAVRITQIVTKARTLREI